MVEQLLLASAATPAEIEQALTGTLALATGLDWVVELEPEAAPWPGSAVPPIALPSAVTGRAMETGRLGAVAAPADPSPTNIEAASTTPLPIAPKVVRLRRFTVKLPFKLGDRRCRTGGNGRIATSYEITCYLFPGIGNTFEANRAGRGPGGGSTCPLNRSCPAVPPRRWSA